MNNIKIIDLGNVGDLAKPVNTLIEKISQVVAAPFVPLQMQRVATAKANVDLIEAKRRIEIEQLQQRAANRFIAEETRKQVNIESIIKKAIPGISESAEPENINDDWLFNFISKSKTISDEQMQTIWAQILSGETNNPGSFSRRTVDFLESLDKYDATLFVDLCSFCCWDGRRTTPFIYDLKDNIFNAKKINFETLTHLSDIKLINFNALQGYQIEGFKKEATLLYYETTLFLSFDKNENNRINAGRVLLTQIGQQLAPICGSQPINGFIEYISEKWHKQKIIVSKDKR
ncbi:MAG: DUF2806 domain-containing protein [Gammaproteobacteria bacterium]|nr:DUF2806 domain-containing protein [Gammaproteobacteria bacterium]